MIRNNLDKFLSYTTIKYDYYFNASLSEVIENDLNFLETKGNFILFGNDTKLIIQNGKKIYFAFPHINPTFFYTRKYLLYESDKLAIIQTTGAGEYEIPVSNEIILLDLNTEEYQYYKFKNVFSVISTCLINRDTILIATYDRLKIFNISTLEEDDMLACAIYSLLNLNNEIIIGRGGRISFWDFEDNRYIKSIQINQSKRIISQMEFLDTQYLVVKDIYKISLVNFMNVVKSVNIYLMEPTKKHTSDGFISRFIIFDKYIIVRTQVRIFIFDHNLDLKVMSESHSMMTFMDVLPNGQLLTISSQSLRIWRIEDMKILFETTDITDYDNVLLN